ncbi:hypothetical protein [Methyloceanibacter sp.]|uniref:hypothetical protein n=1 Tax=Methyloceanibacter sp. TaxID=1965321 RepID=UPI003D6D8544
MLRAALVLALALASPLRPALAEPLDPTPAFIAELQTAIRDNDKDWLADHLHLPVSYFGKRKQVIGSKDWFVKHYATVIGPELRANILKQEPDKYFKNYQGVMVGDGGRNIWIDDFGDEGAGVPTRFEIITINNSE